MNSHFDSSTQSPSFLYKYRKVSVDHLQELQEDIDKLIRENKLSDNKTFRSYINTKKFEIPENFPEAKSIIVMAVFTRPMLVNFYVNGKKKEIIVPPQYYDDGLSEENLRDVVLNEIIKEPGYKIERATRLHLKLIAVRSGLARYGRNNISYVDGMGSFLTLYAYFTDFQFKEDNWNEIRMMDKCENCKICINNCPNNCIREENFVIDAGKCVTLYNEIEGEFPEWITPKAHNALQGCMRCQLPCPANREAIKLMGRLEDITEEETRKVLQGKIDEAALVSVGKKLRRSGDPAEMKAFLPVLTRNLTCIVNQQEK
ncbi:MAG: 4Fe-4S double cluster binding domain-containing protein [Candidatus Odinarchaeota archaeon]